jgi:hypothetical protein
MPFPICMLLYTLVRAPASGEIQVVRKLTGNAISAFLGLCKFRANEKTLFRGIQKLGI